LLGATAAAANDQAADSLVVDLPDIVVSAESDAPPATDRTSLGPVEIEIRDPGSLADLGLALPSARVATNSRGDSHVMIRGAPERHVQTYLDGIPLNLPWDERVDLETVPTVGVGRVEGRRGPTTLLDGPGALAGSVRLLPPTLRGDDPVTRVGAAFGEHGTGRADLMHHRRAGTWNLMGAGAWHGRDALPLPDGDGLRTNSDLEQWSLLLRGARPVRGTGRLSLVATGWSAEKGVPPELHVPAVEARHWRYPVRRRALLGAALDLPLGSSGNWDLGASASADFFGQEIDPRGPDRWGAPLVAGEDYEKSHDRTGFGRLRLTRWLDSSASLALQGSARHTRHTETVVVGGPELVYSQWLTSAAAEGEVHFATAWNLRAGLGWDHATTPEAGDKTANDPASAGALNLRLTRELGRTSTVYAAASRRSRFPSLRESYSGALGKFVPNPELGAERQDQVELGAAWRGSSLRLEGAAFLGRLTDGIEKVSEGDNQFKRVNRARIRVPGVEFIGTWTPVSHWELHAQHTILVARVEDDALPDSPAEDRPDYQSLAGLRWHPPSGANAGIEARVTGPRWSADSSLPTGMMTRLPAGVTWHLRLAWHWVEVPGSTSDIELHLRLDNVFDQRVDDQVGLPGAGRVLSGGINLTL
ncbi:hypothetical protein DRQ50_11205, partial [bacterium]